MSQDPHSPAPSRPGGRLVLADDGAILEAPDFFKQALYLEHRDAPSIYHLFDPTQAPFLSVTRIFRHPYGATETHVKVEGLFGTRRSFRYWQVDAYMPGSVAFYIVDETAITQTHDRDYRRLRREILKDVQNSLSAHFKNRLATVQLLAETLRDAPQLVEQSAPRMLAAVDELKSALNRVITGIPDVQAHTDYKDQPVRLADLEAVISTWGSREVEVRCEVREVDMGTLIAASSIERVVLPVVENAIDASRAGKKVEITIEELDEGFAHIVVQDHGEGMNERVRKRAEDPFFTTRPGHLGMGLAHAREALRDAGGQWRFETEPRKGTRVTLLLPVTTTSQLFRSY